MNTMTATIPLVTFVYVDAVDVACTGIYLGVTCGKVLARRLEGEIEIKCPRCREVRTYRRKVVDL